MQFSSSLAAPGWYRSHIHGQEEANTRTGSLYGQSDERHERSAANDHNGWHIMDMQNRELLFQLIIIETSHSMTSKACYLTLQGIFCRYHMWWSDRSIELRHFLQKRTMCEFGVSEIAVPRARLAGFSQTYHRGEGRETQHKALCSASVEPRLPETRDLRNWNLTVAVKFANRPLSSTCLVCCCLICFLQGLGTKTEL